MWKHFRQVDFLIHHTKHHQGGNWSTPHSFCSKTTTPHITLEPESLNTIFRTRSPAADWVITTEPWCQHHGVSVRSNEEAEIKSKEEVVRTYWLNWSGFCPQRCNTTALMLLLNRIQSKTKLYIFKHSSSEYFSQCSHLLSHRWTKVTLKCKFVRSGPKIVNSNAHKSEMETVCIEQCVQSVWPRMGWIATVLSE